MNYGVCMRLSTLSGSMSRTLPRITLNPPQNYRYPCQHLIRTHPDFSRNYELIKKGGDLNKTDTKSYFKLELNCLSIRTDTLKNKSSINFLSGKTFLIKMKASLYLTVVFLIVGIHFFSNLNQDLISIAKVENLRENLIGDKHQQNSCYFKCRVQKFSLAMMIA